MIIESIILLALALFLLYKWSTSTFDYFAERNVPFEKPFPLFGNQKDLIFRKISISDYIKGIYKKFDTKVFGTFELLNPVYCIRDPDLIKQITIKDFDHFVNHRSIMDENDELIGSSLFAMRNDKWKDMRATLSPVFTGRKMRQMFTLINEVAHESMDFLRKDPLIHNGLELNIKEYFSHITNDVISSAVFGLKTNSFKDEKNEFYTMGKKAMKFSAWQTLKFFLHANFKSLMRLFKVRLFDKKITDYFMRTVLDTMSYRSQHKIMRPDMINMMMEARGIYINDENHKPVTNRIWKDEEIVAQFFLFFFAGFETTSFTMAVASHELMENPDCQEKLRQEILQLKDTIDGNQPSYEDLQGMKYMDMVVSETLRKWPPSIVTDRNCNKDFSYKDDEFEINIKAGETISIPILGIHLDEKYYPNPLKFDPERFSEENKDNIEPFTYLPFGYGPRNCIGSRFALLEVKAILFYLLSEFRIEASAKSSIPLKLDANGFGLAPKNGFWLKLVRLNNES